MSQSTCSPARQAMAFAQSLLSWCQVYYVCKGRRSAALVSKRSPSGVTTICWI